MNMSLIEIKQVDRQDHPFGSWPRSRESVELGTESAPAFRVMRPPTHEDGWTFAPLAGGAWPTDESALLAALPAGRYLLVRGHRAPQVVEEMVFGTVADTAPLHMQQLHTERMSAYVGLVGAHADQPPRFTGALLGLTILHYAGFSQHTGVMFFAGPGMRGEGPPLLILPLEGELVIDVLTLDPRHDRAACVAAWSDGDQSRRIAAALAAEGGA